LVSLVLLLMISVFMLTRFVWFDTARK